MDIVVTSIYISMYGKFFRTEKSKGPVNKNGLKWIKNALQFILIYSRSRFRDCGAGLKWIDIEHKFISIHEMDRK